MNRPGFILPDPFECSQRIAEAIYDIRIGHDNEQTHKLLKNTYVTEDYYMIAVETVYEVNDWIVTPTDKRLFRKIYRTGKR